MLAGTNTFTGGTSLAGGTLRVTNAASLGTGALTVAVSPTLAASTAHVFLPNAISISGGSSLNVNSATTPLFLNGVISGTGTLVASGGVTTLTNTNTYTGGTSIGTGANNVFTGLRIGYGGTTGALGTGAVAFGGAGNNLIYSRSNTLTISNVNPITGAGSVIVNGGTLTLSGGSANTYSGDTIVNGGTLTLSANNQQNIGSSRLLIYPGGVATNTTTHVFGIGSSTNVQLLGGSFTAGNSEFYTGNVDFAGGTLSGANEFRFSGSTTRTLNIIPSVNTSTIALRLNANGSGTNTVNFLVNNGPAADDLTMSRNISLATSVVKNGLGTLRFSATNGTASAYTGTTIFNAGVFIVDFTNSSTLLTNMLPSAVLRRSPAAI
ncbi:MAG: autotransporter-associated beta strand repeat-containing protein [Pirellulales bacterium]